MTKPQLSTKTILLSATVAILIIGSLFLPISYSPIPLLLPILIYVFIGFGIHIITGKAGLLNLGTAGFVAIGAYTYSILTSDIYPFQVGFWFGILISALFGSIFGFLLGIPTLGLKGDYFAIVTLGFGEIVQDVLKNMDVITKGTQGINPVANPTFFGIEINQTTPNLWFILLVSLIAIVYYLLKNLESSPIGRVWTALRHDELILGFLKVSVPMVKMKALTLGAGLSALGGALWTSFIGTSGEPSNYDFQISVIALCIIIIGGLGKLRGVLIGSLVMVGMNSVVLTKLSDWLTKVGAMSAERVWTSPNNWKYAFFGMVLILVMRYRHKEELRS